MLKGSLAKFKSSAAAACKQDSVQVLERALRASLNAEYFATVGDRNSPIKKQFWTLQKMPRDVRLDYPVPFYIKSLDYHWIIRFLFILNKITSSFFNSQLFTTFPFDE